LEHPGRATAAGLLQALDAHMRKSALTGLGAVVVLNGLPGHAGQDIADMMNLKLQHYGATVPALTVWALSLPPGFYVVGVMSLLVLGLGLWRVLSDGLMVCAAFACLILNIAVLLMMLRGVTFVAVRMR
jgi:hypothetical protein